MIYKRLEEHRFAWPPLRDGMMKLSHAKFEAMLAGLDWRRVNAASIRPPHAAE